MSTPPQHPPSPPGGGHRAAVLLGLLAFAAVFVLIVGGTAAVLLLRPAPADEGGTGAPADEPGTVAPAEPTGSPAPTDAPSPAPSAPVEAGTEPAECWSPALPSFDSLPSADVLSGGGLQVGLPEMFAPPGVPLGMPHLDDVQASQAPVEDGWFSTMIIGEVAWPPGVEPPGAEAASQRILQCLYEKDDMWVQVRDRSLSDPVTEAVTVDGMDGFRTTAVVSFAADSLERTDATEITVVVLETGQGPAAFVTETALGVAEHEQATAQAQQDLAAAS